MTALFDDIADFYVTVRDKGNRLLAERRMAYDDRTVQIPGQEIGDDYDGQLELCVLAKNSKGDIRKWFASQCIYLPDNFDSIRKTYGERSSKPFLIHSMRKRIRAPIADGKSKSTKKRTFARSASGRLDATTFNLVLVAGLISIVF